jgi:type I restriction enzyme, S subunit
VTDTELELPQGWSNVKLQNMSNVVDSAHKTPKYSLEGFPMVRVTDVKHRFLDLTKTKKVSKEIFKEFTKKYTPKKNDIVMTRVGTYGACSFVNTDESFCLGQNTIVINSPFTNFLYYFFNSEIIKNQIEKNVVGSTQKTISLKHIRELNILLPPLNEQKIIVSKIEELFSNIDSAKQSLEHTKLQLEQYRQSLLKFAFEGKLTEEWREINKNRLELIIPENKNYEIMDLHGWISCSIGDLIKLSKEKFEPLKGENKILLGLEHIEKHTGRILGQDTSKNTKSTKTVFRSGDVLYGRLRPYFNKITIPDFDGVCSTDILVFQETTNILNTFLKYFLMQGSFVKFTNQNMTGVGLPRISFGKISEFMIQLPSLMEQEQIVSQIELGFSLIENTTQIVNSTLQNLQTMKMSVLKQAFEGKLVPQDPNDEPASVLLERIKLKN